MYNVRAETKHHPGQAVGGNAKQRARRKEGGAVGNVRQTNTNDAAANGAYLLILDFYVGLETNISA